jgi:hypothetical protein
MTRSKIWIFLTVLLLTSCNLPANTPTPEGADETATAVALTSVTWMTQVARATELPTLSPPSTATIAPIPTTCVPTAKTTADANVRSGPDVGYNLLGTLSQGSTAKVLGRNDANTWWYIEYAASPSGYAWISGTVVSTDCLPVNVQVISAQPLTPTATPTNTKTPANKPDLIPGSVQYSPSPAKFGKQVNVQVSVTNSGDAPAYNFSVVWLADANLSGCEWPVSELAAGASETFECDFIYDGTTAASYSTALVVDSGEEVEESNESNNSMAVTLKVTP